MPGHVGFVAALYRHNWLVGVVLHVKVIGGTNAKFQGTLEGINEVRYFVIGATAFWLHLFILVTTGAVTVFVTLLHRQLSYVSLIVLVSRVQLKSNHLVTRYCSMLPLRDEF